MDKHLYIIKDWDRNFENSESRKIKSLGWVPFPNKHDSAHFRRVAALKNAPEIFSAWVLIVQVASKMPTRGRLENSSGPLTPEDLSLMTGFPERIFRSAFDELQKPGIQWIFANLPERPDVLGDSPGASGSVGTEGKGTEGNRTEQNGREGKGTEKGFARLDPWFLSPEFVSAWDGWEEMRKASKSKPTDQARKLAFEKLKSLALDDMDLAIKIINASIESNWKSFYQLKGDNHGFRTANTRINSNKHEKNNREFKENLSL